MKHLTLLLATALTAIVSSCAAINQMNAEEAAEAAIYVEEALQNQNLNIEVTYVSPARGRSFPSTDGYYLRIQDGVVNSYLPFFGESHASIVYGVDPTGIEFKDCPVELYDNGSKPEKGRYSWKFHAMSGKEPVIVYVTFFQNGSAQISCNPTNRSAMNYSGELRPMPEKK